MISNALFGESDYEVAARQARESDAERRREEFIKNERARREADRKAAADRLREAMDFVVKLNESNAKATEKLAESQTQRAEAAANLSRTQGQLKRLADDKLELVREPSPPRYNHAWAALELILWGYRRTS
jgi:hypothetical protein